jgi:hypothetical protein
MGVWAWWCIRETKGIPIEEMDALFGAEHAEGLDQQRESGNSKDKQNSDNEV